MSLEEAGSIEAQYYCRQLQVQKIIGEIKKEAETEQNDPTYLILEEALCTPPLMFANTLSFYRLNVDSFFETIKPAIINLGKLEWALAVMDNLERACKPNS